MEKASLKKRDNGATYITIRCEACPMGEHSVPIRPTPPGYEGPSWDFNGDLEKPTLSPSLRVEFPWGPDVKQHMCHFFIRDGQIQYCGDSKHDLAGQTRPLLGIYKDQS